jgi:hypothetical protein
VGALAQKQNAEWVCVVGPLIELLHRARLTLYLAVYAMNLQLVSLGINDWADAAAKTSTRRNSDTFTNQKQRPTHTA